MEMLYIKVYFDDKDAMDTLTDEERGRLLSAMLDYAAEGVQPVLEGNERILFAIMKKRIDREARAMNELSEKRSACGRKGGRPRSKPIEAPEETGSAAAQPCAEDIPEEDGIQKAIGFSEKQKKLNKDIDKNNNKNKDNNIDRDIYTDTDGDGGSAGCVRARGEDEFYQSVYGLFNSICSELPKVKYSTPDRERLIDERLAGTGGGLDIFREVFRKASGSDFLCGRTEDGSGWKASFDWILSENNWIRICEGCYDTPAVSGSYGGSYGGSSGRSRGGTSSSGVYAPTYDLKEIEQMLDEEWYSQFK